MILKFTLLRFKLLKYLVFHHGAVQGRGEKLSKYLENEYVEK